MKTDAFPPPALQETTQPAHAGEIEQYTLWQILAIWALVTVPMGLLAWVIAPAIIPSISLHPGITYWLLIIAGMVWQFIVSLAIMYRELGTLRWDAIRKRTWLQTPRHPRTNRPNPRLYWWVLPPLLFSALTALIFADVLDAPLARLFPSLQPAPYMDISQLASPEFQGQWWLLGVTLVSFLFNYFLGEEFLFRGVLLPKMQGVFGKYDWVANAVLFGFYHLHLAWAFPSIILSNLAITWPARRFRSNWMAIIVHGADGLFILLIVLAVILGLAPS